jgi:hypothetical protein
VDEQYLDASITLAVKQDSGAAAVATWCWRHTGMLPLRELLAESDLVLTNRWFATAMTTYSPVGPFTLTDEDNSHVADETLDALPLLDARLLGKTIAPELARRGQYLALRAGDETRLLRLDQEITHIGRGPDADIRFEEQGLSRDHAILVRHGRHVRLLDNRSANGTFVNGRRVAATNVLDGDVIDLGIMRLELVEVQ